jgi:protein transport protein SEC31
MKVKEIARTANVAWSPATMQDVHIACGTVAQQLDATFSTSARLEVFALDLASSGLAVPLAGTIESPLRFHKLAWSAHGQEGVNACGVIAGGSDNGTITLWAADKIIRSFSSRPPL